ncbi:hypothetical protein COU37_01565 [Candidatus Micrarchaeota archaeon CG10_big_fil_rev_8_21_14_0_10_45_29]|nr:MAG: hypothetical protein COU37_01565 [Candidatus Micrarchaeota archaeon CG10_big_fil_rev_8_21_14_0_10_45_29]
MKIFTSLPLRWVLLFFMAFCLAVLLDNQDRVIRMVAALVLIVLAQIREISLVNDATPSRKPEAETAKAQKK